MEVGEIFDFVVTTNLPACAVFVMTWGSSLQHGEMTVDGTKQTFSWRALEVSVARIKAWVATSEDVWIQNEVSIVAAGSLDSSSGLCEGVAPLVSWSDDGNGTLIVTENCDEAVRVDLEVFNEVGDILFWSQTILNDGATGYKFGDVRTLLKNNAQVGYRAWHMCALPNSQSTNDWFKCGEAVEAVFIGETSPSDGTSPTSTVAPTEDEAPQPVPVGLLTPVPATPAGGGEVPATPVAQIAVDPSVVILLCEQDCVDKVADRTGIDDGFVEMRIDGGEWGPALGGIIPVGDGLIPVEFRATPLEGEPVILTADFFGNGESIRETSTVKPSGEIVDSDGAVISTVPVYETVEADGSPSLLIVIALIAVLVLLLLAVITMMKRKQRLAQSVNDASHKA